MRVAAGTIQFQLGMTPVTGCGFSYSAEELEIAITGSVVKVLDVATRNTEIKELLV